MLRWLFIILIVTIAVQRPHSPTLVGADRTTADHQHLSENEGKAQSTESESTSMLFAGQVLPANATVAQLFVAHLRSNFEPFWLLFPPTVREVIVTEVKDFYNSTRIMMEGAVMPLISPARKLVRHARHTMQHLHRQVFPRSSDEQIIAMDESAVSTESNEKEEEEIVSLEGSSVEVAAIDESDGIFIGGQLLPANASIADMFVAQIKGDLAPFLLLIPPPVKRYVSSQAMRLYRSLSSLLAPLDVPRRRLLKSFDDEFLTPIRETSAQIRNMIERGVENFKSAAIKKKKESRARTRSVVTSSGSAWSDDEADIIDLD